MPRPSPTVELISADYFPAVGRLTLTLHAPADAEADAAVAALAAVASAQSEVARAVEAYRAAAAAADLAALAAARRDAEAAVRRAAEPERRRPLPCLKKANERARRALAEKLATSREAGDLASTLAVLWLWDSGGEDLMRRVVDAVLDAGDAGGPQPPARPADDGEFDPDCLRC